MDENEVDLRDVLQGRKYPKGAVKVWMDDEPWFELEALEKKSATLLANTPELKQVEKRIKEVKKQIDAEAYVVHIRGISPRAGQDVISTALSEFPFKRDMYGRDDETQQINRNRLISELSFSEHIQKVVWPNGKEQAWTEDNKRDLARAFLGEATASAIDTVDTAIGRVSRKFVEMQAEYANVDF